DVRVYLGTAMRVSDLYEMRLRDGALSPDNLGAWHRTMFQDLVNNRDVASICFSNPKGYCTWLLHAHGRLELGYVDGEDRDHANEWVVQGNGAWDPTTPLRTYRYDALERPWFAAALSQPYPLWTPIYFWFPDQRDASVTGTGYTRAVRSSDGKLLGV